MKDTDFMQLAISLAEKARGKTHPNPLVGCVIVKNGRIIGKGHHKYFGGKHAEVNALQQAGKKAKGATMFVTLEPCCHFGKQPPCTKAIISAGIKTLIVPSKDPNPLVNGKGFKQLKKAGIKINVGLLKKEAENQNALCLILNCNEP